MTGMMRDPRGGRSRDFGPAFGMGRGLRQPKHRRPGLPGGTATWLVGLLVAAFFAVARAAGPVTSVWRVFLGYNLLRCSQFALRVTSTALRRRKTA